MVSLEDLVKDRDKVKVLSSALIDKPHYLAVFLRICRKPCYPEELLNTQVKYFEPRSISRPTVFNILKKFKESGLIEPMPRMLDKRKKYYNCSYGRKMGFLEKI